jgi:hypothetical protein
MRKVLSRRIQIFVNGLPLFDMESALYDMRLHFDMLLCDLKDGEYTLVLGKYREIELDNE